MMSRYVPALLCAYWMLVFSSLTPSSPAALQEMKYTMVSIHHVHHLLLLVPIKYNNTAIFTLCMCASVTLLTLMINSESLTNRTEQDDV